MNCRKFEPESEMCQAAMYIQVKGARGFPLLVFALLCTGFPSHGQRHHAHSQDTPHKSKMIHPVMNRGTQRTCAGLCEGTAACLGKHLLDLGPVERHRLVADARAGLHEAPHKSLCLHGAQHMLHHVKPCDLRRRWSAKRVCLGTCRQNSFPNQSKYERTVYNRTNTLPLAACACGFALRLCGTWIPWHLDLIQ